ncbi:MAG: homocysteine S-methyltransferase family protein [Acidobacteriota bacterium]|nr:homocysteine S-methyltransferase family protein [Acidobacteriota bacterium]
MVTLLDGGMGFELKLRGVDVPSHTESIWSALALTEDPDAVVDVHAAYIEAGADVLTINNYSVTPPILDRQDMGHRVEEMTGLAIDLAEKACATAGRRPRLAGSFPPLETSYRADLVKGREEVLAGYRRIASALKGRVDLIICETLASAREAVWACEAASETGCDFWISWTLQGTRLNTLPSGESLAEAFAALGDLSPSAYLVNCCGANFVTAALPVLKGLTNAPVGGYANAERVVPEDGLAGVSDDPESAQRGAATVLYPDDYAEEVERWLDAGASIVGGCCGTRPKHIRRLREMLDSK